jgi:hydrogenase nickel incorporation protein HypB
MCTVCGCSDNAQTKIDGNTLFRYQSQPSPIKLNQHHHAPDHKHSPETVTLEHNLLAKNDSLAQENRQNLIQRGVFTLNLLSSPGAGKTQILERTIADLGSRFCCQVIEGDQATEQDANRIRKAGAAAVQINTGNGCHLEADMLASGVDILNPAEGTLLFVENVGNLVCPALFDLGEHRRVVILSITEGEDKPIKYPYIFHSADLLLINKIDLLPHLEFDLAACIDYAKTVNPQLNIICVSAQTGEGFTEWYQWLEQELKDLPQAL